MVLQSDRTEGVYSYSSKSNERCIGWNQPFFFNPHLLECRVVEDISKNPIVYKDPVGVVVPYPYANYERIVVWVVEMAGIFLYEPNYRVIDSCHLWDEAYQLDILHNSTKDDLPDEIVLDILARLPVKSLLRFRCVCKPWYSSIANPNFISTHLLNHNHQCGYVIHIPRNIPEPSCSIHGSSHSSGQVCTLAYDRTFETIFDFRVPFTYQSGHPSVVGSCNGILCFNIYNSAWSNVFYLWNPSIRKFKRLPDIQFPIVTFRIGCDSQNNDFKVVGLSPAFAKPKPPLEVCVYSLSSDSWKRVELGISLRPNDFYYNVNNFTALPFVSGHLHCMLYERHFARMLLSFDVNSEKFKQLPLPDDEGEGSCFMKFVTSFKGKLALIEYRSGAQPHSTLCSIWVMREYGMIDSWNKLRVLSIGNLLHFIGFTRYGLLLVQKAVSTNSELEWKDKYVLIDLETLHEKEISTQVNYHLDVATYMESLALLDGRNVVSH
nr:F-box/kelch-repeat protein At3g23880-like [Quercus suber]